MKYRPGDVLLVRATVVESTCAANLMAQFTSDKSLWLDTLDVASVEHARIALGDTVRRTSPSGPLTGEVLATHEDALWVQLTTGQMQTWRTTECERVD